MVNDMNNEQSGRPEQPATPKNLAPQKWPEDEDRIDIAVLEGEHYCGIIGGNE
jgi:hypothetical protein